MLYMGSKARIAKEILAIILKDRTKEQYFCDMFSGGQNIIDKVSGRRLSNDSHPYLIPLIREISEGWIPPQFVSECEYNSVRITKECYPDYYVGFVGFCCTFAGKFFAGYARDNSGKRNYCKERGDNLVKQAPLLKGIEFKNESYINIDIPDNSVIYCDPPYKLTTGYRGTDKFDYDEFWQWCRDKSKEHRVFISEYNAPDDFECIWSKSLNCPVAKKKVNKSPKIEKLFKYRG